MTRLHLADEGRQITEPNPWSPSPQPERGAGRHLSAEDFDCEDDAPAWLPITIGVLLFVASAVFLTWLEVGV